MKKATNNKVFEASWICKCLIVYIKPYDHHWPHSHSKCSLKVSFSTSQISNKIQLEFYRSGAERCNCTTSCLSRPPCPTQYWELGILPKEFYCSTCAIKFPFPNFCFQRWLLLQLPLSLSENSFLSTKSISKWTKQR